MPLRHVLLALHLLTCLQGAAGAEFSVLCDTEMERASGCSIQLSGQIVPGDAQRLSALLKDTPPGVGIYRTLVLNSPGGNVGEALRIADVVRKAALSTANYRLAVWDLYIPGKSAHNDAVDRASHHKCASACFLIWVAGSEREHVSGTLTNGTNYGLGLHRPSFPLSTYEAGDPDTIARKHQDVAAAVMEYLRREQIPEPIVSEMMRRSSREVLWLDWSSGAAKSIHSKAVWYEEALIARCRYDPRREREMDGEYFASEYTSGRTKRPKELKHRYDEYIAWIQTVSACAREKIVVPAQAGFRR